MKQILRIAIVGLLIISAPQILKAQTQKGSWLIEGNLGNINVYTNKNESNSGISGGKTDNQGYNISLYPRIGYFFNNNFVAGTTVSYSYRTNEYKGYWSNSIKSHDGKNKRSSIGLSPFIRYYFTKNLKNRFYAQIGGGLNIGLKGNEEATTFYDDGEISGTYKNQSKEQAISGEALLGFNHFFTNCVALNSSIGYNYSKITENKTSNSTYGGIAYAPQETINTSLTGNIVWNFGFTFVIPSNKED